MFNAFKQFTFLENAQDRLNAIKNCAKSASPWQLNLLTWQILSLLPTNKEKIALIHTLNLAGAPGSAWALFSYLLQEEHDDEVIGECILNLAKERNHPFDFKIQEILEKKHNSLEVISSVLEYVEKTGDEKFKKFLTDNTKSSYKFNDCLEKQINACLKLCVINLQLKELCLQILCGNLYQYENSTLNAAIFYIFFSINHKEKAKLSKIRTNLNNTSLLKIFDLCFYYFNSVVNGNSSQFLENALLQTNPCFLGYGVLNENEFPETTLKFIEKYALSHPIEVTKVILNLRNERCTEVLSEHAVLGITAIEKKQNRDISKIWTELCPFYNNKFVNSVRNPENYNLWLDDDTLHVGFDLLDDKILFQQNKSHLSWQTLFEKSIHNNMNISVNILLLQINALKHTEKRKSLEKIVLKNIKSCLKLLKSKEDFTDKVYAMSISINPSPDFIKGIYSLIPFSCTSWAFIAIALTAPKLDAQTLNYAILQELNSIREALLKENLDKEEYILEVTTRFQSILIGPDKFHVQVIQSTLSALSDIASLIQSILDSVDENNKDSEGEELFGDWNGGQLALDKPIMRWNAVLQVCLNPFLTKEELSSYEKILCESLKIAPHVDKRWVVRALVHIDSDEAIKTILYFALNHLDSDFVHYTIFELFSSQQPRAKQALVRAIGKNNLSEKAKIAIVEHIKLNATQNIVREFKDLAQMRLPEKIEEAVQNTLVEIAQKNNAFFRKREEASHKFTSSEIDFVIKTFIHNVTLLSVDSRSSLRTAEMIFIQSKEWGKEGVDLSPILNMYCKSLELVLRDTFEPFTDSIMRKGRLSKKLEIIGYSKLNQEKMQVFEDYIAELPIINTIPYFSKFKLRKMLRAICLYRPGKRFTLDGPKAFALFLLISGRKSCAYSLENLFHLPFLNDLELFNFVKQVHLLQDSRNRAVHEGLTWEARDEIDNIRKQCYLLIDSCLKIGVHLNKKQRENEASI